MEVGGEVRLAVQRGVVPPLPIERQPLFQKMIQRRPGLALPGGDPGHFRARWCRWPGWRANPSRGFPAVRPPTPPGAGQAAESLPETPARAFSAWASRCRRRIPPWGRPPSTAPRCGRPLPPGKPRSSKPPRFSTPAPGAAAKNRSPRPRPDSATPRRAIPGPAPP